MLLDETESKFLVHIGLDTVGLNGQGFESLVKVGTKVKKGTPIIKVDLYRLKVLKKMWMTGIEPVSLKIVKQTVVLRFTNE
ncbi:PTS glucose transporter subunit IIA [Enterococcus sp. DIV0800]|uniref:PTS glucose transporter subunit IIA n=1 Tax=unclassified Enterococcus TaxID=2608891 RepID=UPI003D2FD7DF